MPADKELKQILVQKRANLKGKLTRFENGLESFTRDKLTELKKRFKDIEGILKEFDDIQIQIELLGKVDKANVDERVAFEDRFFRITALAEEKIEALSYKHAEQNASASNQGGVQVQTPQLVNIKLPELQLQQFDGGYENWTTFYDSFTSLID